MARRRQGPRNEGPWLARDAPSRSWARSCSPSRCWRISGCSYGAAASPRGGSWTATPRRRRSSRGTGSASSSATDIGDDADRRDERADHDHRHACRKGLKVTVGTGARSRRNHERKLLRTWLERPLARHSGKRRSENDPVTFEQNLAPYRSPRDRTSTSRSKLAGASADSNEVKVEGGERAAAGGARRARRCRALRSAKPDPVRRRNRFELTAENEDGSTDTQAGSHPVPADARCSISTRAGTTNAGTGETSCRSARAAQGPAGQTAARPGRRHQPRRDSAVLGLRLLDDRTATATSNRCPANTAIGVAVVSINEPH